MSLITCPGRPMGRRARRTLRKLAGAAPFDMDAFCECLERQSDRPVRLVPEDLWAGVPSGVYVRTADADYLCYERQTSPFHQAHVLVCLAAEVLLGGGPGPRVDRRLFPDVSPRLAELILGGAQGAGVGESAAEAFALEAMDRAAVSACPASVARWFMRQLRPLHTALLEAKPEAARPPGTPGPEPARRRLHRQVIEIRDAALALRPYRSQQVIGHAAAMARAAGLRGEAYAAAVEAGALAAAIRASQAGRPQPGQPEDTAWRAPFEPRAELQSEAAWLARVSRAFTRLPAVPDQPGTRWLHSIDADVAPVPGEEGTRWR